MVYVSINAVITRFAVAGFQLPNTFAHASNTCHLHSFTCILCLFFVLNMGTGVHSSLFEKLEPFSALSQCRAWGFHSFAVNTSGLPSCSPFHQASQTYNTEQLNSLYLEFIFLQICQVQLWILFSHGRLPLRNLPFDFASMENSFHHPDGPSPNISFRASVTCHFVKVFSCRTLSHDSSLDFAKAEHFLALPVQSFKTDIFHYSITCQCCQ